MAYLLERLTREFSDELKKDRVSVIIATSAQPENRVLRKEFNLPVFFGHPSNIPLRHYELVLNYGLDGVVAVDGDDILCSKRATRAVYEGLLEGEAFIESRGLPTGMNARGYSSQRLETVATSTSSSDVVETGWIDLFGESDRTVEYLSCLPTDNLRFTLDYEQDLVFFEKLIGRIGASEIIHACDERIVKTCLGANLQEVNEEAAEWYQDNLRTERDV